MILNNLYTLGGLLLSLYLIAGMGFLMFTKNYILYIFYLELMYLIIFFSIILLSFFLNFQLLYVILLALVVATVENCILILILVMLKFQYVPIEEVNVKKSINSSVKNHSNYYIVSTLLLLQPNKSFTVNNQNFFYEFLKNTGFSDFLVLYLLTILPILLAVAYVILWERKLMASVQRRRGPNVVGLYGILQPLIDAVKLLLKEVIIPDKVNQILFVLGPVITLVISLTLWTTIPFSAENYYYDYEYGLLVFLGISSLGPYGIIISGWASNSSYAILGSLRSIAQFISYEVILTFLLLPIIMYSESLNFIEIVYFQKNFMWFCIPLFPFFIWFIVAVLAETNRTPFDLPEAEAELVAGYNTEYAGVFFIMFMLAEYSNLLCMSALISLLFVGGWDFGFFEILINIFIPEDIVQYLNFFLPELIFAIKITLFVSLFIVIRATLPRFRFDQLMSYCWCHLLPLSFGVLIFTIYIYVLTLNIAFFI